MVTREFTKQEIIEITKDANYVDIYWLKNPNGEIHTDNLYSSADVDHIDDIPFDEDGKVDACIEIMGREDYANTVLANSSIFAEDVLDKDETVAIIVLAGNPFK